MMARLSSSTPKKRLYNNARQFQATSQKMIHPIQIDSLFSENNMNLVADLLGVI